DAKFVALGAPRIGFGTDPASYDGLTVTNAIMNLLTQSGAQLTVRSQSTIDFAGGTYDFGDIRFDAASLSSLDGGDVLVHGGTVGLGNTGGDALVCADCSAGDGAFQIDAQAIVFTGGELTTKASVLNADTPVLISTAVTAILPAGTRLTAGGSTFVMGAPAEIAVPVGTALNLAAGTGLLMPDGAAGMLASGTTVSPEKGGNIVLAQGGSFYLPNGLLSCAGTVCGPALPGVFTLSNDTTVPLPSGAQVQLQAPAQVNLTQFFGQVGLSAANGISTRGKGSVLDVGSASLSLKAPVIAAQPSGSAVVPDLALVSTNAVSIDGSGLTAPAAAGVAPGAAITIQGQSVSITSAILRAPAGQVTVEATDDIVLAGGTKMDASGYVATFGDSADPTTQNAPGGKLTLQAANGSISLGDSTLSVGGGTGDAGTLSLLAPAGSIDFGTAALDGKAGAQGLGGTFILDERNALDLGDLNARVGADGFTGGFGVHTGTGDLLVGANEIIRSSAVMLTADGGSVEIAGTIDTSGINGGDVALYGRSGVTLDASARITATASGYPDNDTRQAKGGNVTLGTDYIASTVGTDGLIDGQSGRISVANGALVDVSAKRQGARLVPYNANGTQYFNYVESDQGGTVTFRAPVAGPSGAETA
ncbi:MAG TPA: hypothetical protein VFQ52_05000, partial [Rhizomicrobium sp.]|nr:hypothetical protein [Rhizomicrobium sp.]